MRMEMHMINTVELLTSHLILLRGLSTSPCLSQPFRKPHLHPRPNVEYRNQPLHEDIAQNIQRSIHSPDTRCAIPRRRIHHLRENHTGTLGPEHLPADLYSKARWCGMAGNKPPTPGGYVGSGGCEVLVYGACNFYLATSAENTVQDGVQDNREHSTQKAKEKKRMGEIP